MFGVPGYRTPLLSGLAAPVLPSEVLATRNYERMHRAAMARERRLFDKH
jgi:hypothetical protein